MKRLVLAILLFCILSLGGAFAETETFGVGVLLGEPTGISAKLRLGPTSALDAAAAWSFTKNGAFYFHGDYLFHFNDVLHVNPGELPVYVGIGGKLLLKDDPRLGARIPLGLAYEFAEAPLDVFFEIAPGVGIFPETDIDFGGGIGIRYYFGSAGTGS